MRHSKFLSRRAESLIETIIAITVIIIGSSAAIGMTRTSLTGNENIGQKMVAMNLAEEGIEGVLNIRDSNYLRFASDPDACWKTLSATTSSNCATSTVISDGTYYLTRDLSTYFYQWSLSTAVATKVVYSYAIDSTHQLYANRGASTAYTSTATIYSRTLTVSNTSADSFDLTSTITWTEDGISKSLSLTRTIANVY